MAIIKSKTDSLSRKQAGIDTNLNAKQFHDVVDARQGTVSEVNQLEKKYVLNTKPNIINTIMFRHK